MQGVRTEVVTIVYDGPDTSDWTPLSEWPFPLGVTPPEGWVPPRKRMTTKVLPSPASGEQGPASALPSLSVESQTD